MMNEYLIEELCEDICNYEVRRGEKPKYLILGIAYRTAINLDSGNSYLTKEGKMRELAKFWGIPIIKLEETISLGSR